MVKVKKEKSRRYRLAKIRVVGVGGAGSNAVSRMFDALPRGVEMIAVNTDLQDLNHTRAKKKIQIGKNLTRGLGTGMNPDLGKQAAEENREEIAAAIHGSDMIFIMAGFGGGSGTGAAPIVAEVAQELGILSVAIVTKPFAFEGAKRMQIAEEGLLRIKDRVDTLITIPNDRVFSLIEKDTPLTKAFEVIDDVLKNSVAGITELITIPGMVNIDFADVKTIVKDGGSAMIGIGVASGPDRSLDAVNQVLNSPLLEAAIDGAKGVLFSISGRRDLKMSEVNEIAKLVAESVDPGARIIFGTYHDRKLKKGQVKVTLVATGFNGILNKAGLFGAISQPLSLKIPAEVKMEEVLLPSPRPATGKRSYLAREETMETKEAAKSAQDFENPSLFEGELQPAGGPVKSEKGEIWDTPAFLRRKKRRNR